MKLSFILPHLTAYLLKPTEKWRNKRLIKEDMLKTRSHSYINTTYPANAGQDQHFQA